MKRLIFCIALLVTTFCQAQNVVDSTLVAYWNFDGNTNDSGIYGNNGIAFGEPLYVPGYSGQGLAFDGVDDFVLVYGKPSLHNLTKEYTFAGWVKPFGVPNFYVPIVTKGNSTDMRTPLAVLYRSPETTPYIRIAGAGLPFDLVNVESVTNACPLNEWTFFTWTYKLGKVSVYKNTELVAEHQFGFTQLAYNILPMDIGRDRPGFATEWLYGILDEMCIFNRALSLDEIQQVYRSKLVSSTKDLTIDAEEGFKIQPNPAAQEVKVTFLLDKGWGTVLEISNQLGVVVQTIPLDKQSSVKNSMKIDISNLPNGNYWVIATHNGKKMAKGFIVAH